MKFVSVVDPINVSGGVKVVITAMFGDFVCEIVESFVNSSGGLMWFFGK